ncbi:MAG TPA: tRNA (guanosine(46)-N7)-methyltransferase TrmB [Cyclobacteriaceae bacterium]
MKGKLLKFAENARRNNVIQEGKELYHKIKGNWGTYFGNQNPLLLEIGCGNGAFTIGLAEKFPHLNIIGLDIKGARIWSGSRYAEENGIKNIAFLRTQADWLEKFFQVDEVCEIWITFPDPRPKKRDEKRRLTHPRFLNIYQKIMKNEGFLHFKTDDLSLFQYSIEAIKSLYIKNLKYTFDLYNSNLMQDDINIQTKYERVFLSEGKSIKYCSFQFHHIE